MARGMRAGFVLRAMCVLCVLFVFWRAQRTHWSLSMDLHGAHMHWLTGDEQADNNALPGRIEQSVRSVHEDSASLLLRRDRPLYLLYNNRFGQLNNQLISLSYAAVIARHLRATLVLPRFDERDGKIRWLWGRNEAKPFSFYFDVDTMRRFVDVTEHNEFVDNVIGQDANETATVYLMDKDDLSNHKRRPDFWGSVGTVYNEYGFKNVILKDVHTDKRRWHKILSAGPTGSPLGESRFLMLGWIFNADSHRLRRLLCEQHNQCNIFEEFFRHLVLHPRIQAKVDMFLNEFQPKFAVHLRDMDNQCEKRTNKHGKDMYSCEPNVTTITQTLRAAGARTGDVVFIAHDNHKLHVVTELNSTVGPLLLWNRDAGRSLGGGKYTLALMDAAVCEAVPVFVGNPFSSFSIMIGRRRVLFAENPRAECRHMYGYNGENLVNCHICEIGRMVQLGQLYLDGAMSNNRTC